MLRESSTHQYSGTINIEKIDK